MSFLGRWINRGKHHQEHQQESDNKDQPPTINADLPKIVSALEGITKRLDRDYDERGPDKNWERKWRRWEVRGLWAAAAVGVGAIIWSSIDAERARGVMHDQQIVMQRQLDEMQAEQRAWVYVTPYMNGPVISNARGLSIPLKVIFQNTGHQPALHVLVDIQGSAFAGGPYPFDFVNRQKKECASDKKLSASNLVPSYSEFPGQPLIQYTDATVSLQDMQANALAGNTMPIIYGCITYFSAGNSTIHQTGFSYQVLAQHQDAVGMFMIPDNRAVDKPQAAILRLPIASGTEFAN